MWMLPHVKLQRQDDDTVLFLAEGETKERAIERIAEHLVSLDIAGWSKQYTRYIRDWLSVSEPVVHDITAAVRVSKGNVTGLKATRRRIRAAKAMESVGSELFAGCGRDMPYIEVR